ncbi:MAG: hypothetical protein HYS77_08765, partial [Candidatus Rokubacteria bacterium]|nr:hypothetical protein [Candidatus Rokubacteria bacterium]
MDLWYNMVVGELSELNKHATEARGDDEIVEIEDEAEAEPAPPVPFDFF